MAAVPGKEEAMRTLRVASVLAAAALVSVPSSVALGSPPRRVYEVTITNLTSGQPLTPPVVATHRGAYDAFDVGGAASVRVQQIAENGNGGPLLAELGLSKHVSDFLETTTGPLVPAETPGAATFDDSVTFEVTAAPGANRLTFVSMLICTNDGFTGADGVKLPTRVGKSVTRAFAAYDAGTEINTEDLADMVPPCQGLIGVADDGGAPGTGMSDPALAEGGVIHHHPGIQGGADLVPAIHGWNTSLPVSSVTIERTA
jgi:hypothetical protein